MNSSLLSIFFIPFFLFLLPIFSKAQTDRGNVNKGASLTAKKDSSSWTSLSGDFAFGFQPLENNNDLFLLSIWYNMIPERTIVWCANVDKPAPEGSEVDLSDDGLVLRTPQGDEIWRSQNIMYAVSHGAMEDTGNFVLYANSIRVWESFQNPTDTLLPSQEFGKNGVLSSKQSKTDFSRGRFQFRLTQEGNLVMNTINLPGNSANEAYYTAKGRVLEFFERQNGQLFRLSQDKPPSVREFYVRATLDPDGIFALYSYPKGSKENRTCKLLWSVPENICTATTVLHGLGICGYNSICKLGPNNRPNCSCPKNYTFLDPNDRFSSCIPEFTLSCQVDQRNSSEDLFTLEVLSNTNWPTSDYIMLQPFSEDQCKTSCLEDCMCAVAIHGGNMCWKKKLPLSNGVTDPTVLRSTAFVKVPKGTLPPSGASILSEKDCKSLITVESAFLLSLLFFNCLLVAVLYMRFFLIYWRKPGKTVETNLRCFTYKELIQATNGFEEKLGKGAFGVVYKGLISNSPVAIKKLYNLSQDYEKQFKNELKVIGQTHHKNLVHLIGFCEEGQERLLVYEFMSNGSLAKLLFGESKPSWKQRCQIAFDIARGLLYLHEECSTLIIHFDIKPENILLNDYYTAKISDFGLAKLLQINQSQTYTALKGTIGYLAPEWLRGLPVTEKVDVYSFGVLLLEIVFCRKSSISTTCGSGEQKRISLTNLAYDYYRKGRLDALVEGDIEDPQNMDMLNKMVMIAIWCIQEEPSMRPSLKKISQMLEGTLEVPRPPCPFPFPRTETTNLNRDT